MNKSLFIILISFALCLISCTHEPAYKNPHLFVEARVNDLIERLTIEEKVSLLQHNQPAIERLGILPYNWWNEALHGVGQAGLATVFPQPIGLAATFDDEAIRETFSIIGDESRAKFNQNQRDKKYGNYQGLTFFTPNINIFRDPRWGRGMETFGEDPFLTGKMGTAVVKGLQGTNEKYYKSIACAKHLAVHSGPEALRHAFDASVSTRDLYTTYLPAFKDLIDAGVQQVMCAYNRFEGVPCCSSEELLNQILREKWHYKGLIVTDCWAINDFWEKDTVISRHKTHETQNEAVADAFKNGVDLECGNSLNALLEIAGTDLLPEDVIDQRLKKVLKYRFELGLFDPDSLVPWSDFCFDVVDCQKHKNQALDMARKSIVLLKNENHVLPFSEKMKKIAVVGPNANDSIMLLGNYNGTPSKTVTILKGISEVDDIEVYYEKGCNIVDNEYVLPKDFFDQIQKSDVVVFVGGISPQLEGEQLGVFCEGFNDGDRTKLELPAVQQDLLKKLKATEKPVVLVLCTGSAIALNWENEHLDAIVNTWYGGQAAGTAVADVLFGKYNPAGRLPITFYQSVEQLPDFENYDMTGRTYRYMTEKPLYPFGFGLSYTDFETALVNQIIDNQQITFDFEITNTGKTAGDEVLQLYFKNPNDPQSPMKTLVGFKRVFVEAGKTVDVRISVPLKQCYSFDDETEKFVFRNGKYLFQYGKSSADNDLKEIEIDL